MCVIMSSFWGKWSWVPFWGMHQGHNHDRNKNQQNLPPSNAFSQWCVWSWVPFDGCDHEFLFGGCIKVATMTGTKISRISTLPMHFPSGVCDHDFLLMDVIMSSFFGDASKLQPWLKKNSRISAFPMPFPSDVCDHEFLLVDVIMSSFFGDASKSQAWPEQ